MEKAKDELIDDHLQVSDARREETRRNVLSLYRGDFVGDLLYCPASSRFGI
jgi:hypothetical protein